MKERRAIETSQNGIAVTTLHAAAKLAIFAAIPVCAETLEGVCFIEMPLTEPSTPPLSARGKSRFWQRTTDAFCQGFDSASTGHG